MLRDLYTDRQVVSGTQWVALFSIHSIIIIIIIIIIMIMIIIIIIIIFVAHTFVFLGLNLFNWNSTSNGAYWHYILCSLYHQDMVTWRRTHGLVNS